MTMIFLLHKDKEKNMEKATAQKQECGCPYLKPSLRSHTHAFLSAHGRQCNNLVKATTLSGAKNK
jgi:hypothetical protein